MGAGMPPLVKRINRADLMRLSMPASLLPDAAELKQLQKWVAGAVPTSAARSFASSARPPSPAALAGHSLACDTITEGLEGGGAGPASSKNSPPPPASVHSNEDRSEGQSTPLRGLSPASTWAPSAAGGIPLMARLDMSKITRLQVGGGTPGSRRGTTPRGGAISVRTSLATLGSARGGRRAGGPGVTTPRMTPLQAHRRGPSLGANPTTSILATLRLSGVLLKRSAVGPAVGQQQPAVHLPATHASAAASAQPSLPSPSLCSEGRGSVEWEEVEEGEIVEEEGEEGGMGSPAAALPHGTVRVDATMASR